MDASGLGEKQDEGMDAREPFFVTRSIVAAATHAQKKRTKAQPSGCRITGMKW
jgi:hypothetical protein